MKSLVACFILSLSTTLFAEELKVLAWNVQNDDSWARIIANQLNDLQREFQFDLIGLSEVDEENALTYASQVSIASGRTYASVVSSTGGGGNDSLVALYDTSRFTFLEKIEPTESGNHAMNWRDQNGQWRLRTPLAIKLIDRKTNQTFIFMVNHLKRGAPVNQDRDSQVRGLNHWAQQQRLPVINVGDFNFDWNPQAERGNPSFHLMTENAPWTWIRPEPLVDTNWYEDRSTPEIDDLYPNAILDFVFVAGDAGQWNGVSNVIVRPGDFPDNSQTSDHRPITATFQVPANSGQSGNLIDHLSESLAEIERRLTTLEFLDRPLSVEELKQLQRLAIARENLRNTIRLLQQ